MLGHHFPYILFPFPKHIQQKGTEKLGKVILGKIQIPSLMTIFIERIIVYLACVKHFIKSNNNVERKGYLKVSFLLGWL